MNIKKPLAVASGHNKSVNEYKIILQYATMQDKTALCEDFRIYNEELHQYMKMIATGDYRDALIGMENILDVMHDTMPGDFDANICKDIDIPGGIYNRKELEKAREEFKRFREYAEKPSHPMDRILFATECSSFGKRIESVKQLGKLKEMIEEDLVLINKKYKK